MSFIDTFINANGIEGDLARLMKGEDVVVPEEFTETPDDYYKSLLEAHEQSRVDLFKVKHAEPLIEAAVAEKLKDTYQATVNPIRNKMVKLFDLELDDKDADPKEVLESIYSKYTSDIEAASKEVNPDTSALTKQINNLKASLTKSNTEFEDYKTKTAKELATAVAQARTESQSTVVEMMYADEFAKIEPKLIAQERSLYKAMKNELEDYGYRLSIIKKKNGADTLIVQSSTGTDAMNLDQTKTVSDPSIIMLEIANDKNWIKRNNNDKKRDGNLKAGAANSRSMSALSGFLNKGK
jgi:hypothetical protein